MTASKIEWTHRPGTKGETWNPIRARNKQSGKIGHFCVKASPGCANCYAERLQKPYFGNDVRYAAQDLDKVEIFVDEKTLLAPLRWRSPRTVFVCSMTDLFGDFVPDAMIDRMFAVMALARRHTFIALTKRTQRMRNYFSAPTLFARLDLAIRERWDPNNPRINSQAFMVAASLNHGGPCWPLPNVWLGVSAEDQQRANERIPVLLQTPAAARFVSCEPLIGPIDLARWLPAKIIGGPDEQTLYGLDWVIVGGESGHGARPMHPDWARALRDQCEGAGVAFFFKQWGSYQPEVPQYPNEYGLDDEACDLTSGRDFPCEGVLYRSGYFYDGVEFQPHVGAGAYWMERVGKKAAGRLLDGKEHNDFPDVAAKAEAA